jgi:serine/threonine-protein kinase
MPDLRLGDVLGPYRLETVLGEGAIGVVVRSTRSDGTVVALKVLKQPLSRNDVYRQRFLREARVAQEVRHPHLVPVIEAGEAGGYHYLAFGHVEGGSLDEHIAAVGSLPIADCVRLAAELASGLDALHSQGIVHRDVKPSNVMLDSAGSAALTDFGLAKGPAYTVLTRPGQIMGTLDYIAPEVIRGEAAEPASDVYSLGCVVYECLVGAPPFADRRLFEIAVAHLEADPPDASARRADVPRAVAEVVQHALAKEPARRPRTGRAFAHLLRAAAAADRGSR